MTDLAFVAAGVVAAVPQPEATTSPTHFSPVALQRQEDQLIEAVLASPAMPSAARVGSGTGPGMEPPQFSPSASATLPGRSPEAARRAQLEARLRQLEQSALAQTPGAVVSFELPPSPKTQPPRSFPQPPRPLPRQTPLLPAPATAALVVPAATQAQPRPAAPAFSRSGGAPQTILQPRFSPPSGVSVHSGEGGDRTVLYRSASVGRVGDRIWNTHTRYQPSRGSGPVSAAAYQFY